MIKKIVIAGCRDYENYEEAKQYIEFCIKNIREKYELVFISGGCRGADNLGEKFARENGFEVKKYSANWEKYGRAAGPIRNEEMANDCDYVICFWDGKSKGTKSMIELAKEKGKKVKIKMI